MSQDQNSPVQRRKILSTPILLGCGCLLVVFCLAAGLVGLKFGFGQFSAADSDFEPAWSPDGKQIAFISARDGANDIYVMQSDGTHVVRLTNALLSLALLPQNIDPAWSPDNRQLAFASNRRGHQDIYTMNNDGSHVVRLTDGTAQGKYSSAEPDWSPDGRQILFTSQVGQYGGDLTTSSGPTADIYVVDVDGTHLARLTDLAGYVQSPKWSPDGSRIAFVLVKSQTDIYIMDADGSNLERVTNNSAYEFDLAWSPDGSRIAFTSGDIYHHNIYIMNADGTQIEKLTDAPGLGDSSPYWSPDGLRIVFQTFDPETRYDHLFTITADGSNLVQLTGKE
jgi:Tol biopolymer transport system component